MHPPRTLLFFEGQCGNQYFQGYSPIRARQKNNRGTDGSHSNKKFVRLSTATQTKDLSGDPNKTEQRPWYQGSYVSTRRPAPYCCVVGRRQKRALFSLWQNKRQFLTTCAPPQTLDNQSVKIEWLNLKRVKINHPGFYYAFGVRYINENNDGNRQR